MYVYYFYFFFLILQIAPYKPNTNSPIAKRTLFPGQQQQGGSLDDILNSSFILFDDDDDELPPYEDLLALFEESIDMSQVKSKSQYKGNLDKLNDIVWNSTMVTKSCSICLCDFEQGDSVSLTECIHTYHDVCIKEWFKVSSQCPICKHEHRK